MHTSSDVHGAMCERTGPNEVAVPRGAATQSSAAAVVHPSLRVSPDPKKSGWQMPTSCVCRSINTSSGRGIVGSSSVMPRRFRPQRSASHAPDTRLRVPLRLDLLKAALNGSLGRAIAFCGQCDLGPQDGSECRDPSRPIAIAHCHQPVCFLQHQLLGSLLVGAPRSPGMSERLAQECREGLGRHYHDKVQIWTRAEMALERPAVRWTGAELKRSAREARANLKEHRIKCGASAAGRAAHSPAQA